MNKKEYGGYLPIVTLGKDYFANIDESSVIRLNAARYAIVCACQDGEYSKIWIPVYMCYSVYEALNTYGIQYGTYNIDSSFKPIIKNIKSTECILITNFFGIQGENFYDEMVEQFKNVIFDNTQCFYSIPVMKKDVYNVYSPRKFFGVPDGAYLIAEQIRKKQKFQQDLSAERSGYLFKSIESGTNAVYDEYLVNEQEITNNGMRNMSKLTQVLLNGIDYEKTKEIRQNNYRFLVAKLQSENELLIREDVKSPMVYPLVAMHKGAEFRKYLISSRIYVPQWWKWVSHQQDANEWEKILSNYLYPIPIDQRYTLDDMENIVRIIQRFN